MCRNLLTFFLLITAFAAFGQARKEWQEGYTLSVLDFGAEPPESQVEQGQSYYLAAHLDYPKATNRSELKLVKNLNQQVTAYFNPNQSWLQQGEGTEILLKCAQMDFDLLELYARKYRKRLYEEKQALANSRFLLQAQQEINAGLVEQRQEMQSALAQSNEKANAFHGQILKELAALAAFSKQSAINYKQH